MPVNTVKVCARCGGDNNRSASVCSHCGARLPNLELNSPDLLMNVEQLTDRYNQMADACARVKTEEMPDEEFRDYLTTFRESLREKKRKAFILNDEGEPEYEDGDSGDEYEDIPEYEHFRRGIDAMWPFFEDFDESHLDAGLEIIREGNDKLLGGNKVPESGAAMESVAAKVACVLCGTENELGATVCSQCGAKLPKFDQTSVPQEKHKQVTERYDQFKRAVDKLKGGQWSDQEFGAFLEQVEEALRAKRVVYQGVLGETGYAEYAGDEVNLATSGMDDYESGLQELWGYFEDHDESRFDRALSTIWSGNEKINKAMVMNRNFRKDLTEQFGYI